MPDLARAPEPVRTTRTHTSWGVEIGPLRVAVTRTRQIAAADLGYAPARPSGEGWTLAKGALAGVSALTLLVVGASATPRSTAGARAVVSVEIPEARAVVRAAVRRVAPGRAAPRAARPASAAVTGAKSEVGEALYLDRAMATGAFQEWEDEAGQQRFLTAGPARIRGGRTCRDMALLTRLAEGGSHVRSLEHCTSAPVEAPALQAPEDSMPNPPEVRASGSADE